MDIRLSLGSATQLELREMRMDVAPTTLYVMLGEQCYGACAFCTQSRDNTSDRKYLSRIIWPAYDIEDVAERIKSNKDIHRICVQTLKDPEMLSKLPLVVEQLNSGHNKPISVCLNPVERSYLEKLKQAGVERAGTGLDCATPESFSRIKPGFSWTQYQQFIQDTIEVFGRGSVHLIVGLGDSDYELIDAFQRYTDMGCSIGLFALTKVRGIKLPYPAPRIERYRALQLARYLISTSQGHPDQMVFMDGKLQSIQISKNLAAKTLSAGIPFRTSGCPDCNRPNYNERPGGVMYNFAKSLNSNQLTQAINELQSYVRLEYIS